MGLLLDGASWRHPVTFCALRCPLLPPPHTKRLVCGVLRVVYPLSDAGWSLRVRSAAATFLSPNHLFPCIGALIAMASVASVATGIKFIHTLQKDVTELKKQLVDGARTVAVREDLIPIRRVLETSAQLLSLHQHVTEIPVPDAFSVFACVWIRAKRGTLASQRNR
jgi:hypothetical protein